MSKATRPGARYGKPRAAKPRRRRVGRDLLAFIIVGLSLGLGFAWTGTDIAKVGARVQELASDLSGQSADDKFPVSSIGDKTQTKRGDPRRYPICRGGGGGDNCVVDGDTFRMDGATIRISDIDAPETHPPRCAYETDLGDRATRRLSRLLSAHSFQLVRADRDLDRYGRQLRVVIRDGRSIGKMLVAEGLARPWTGKRRPWCGGNDGAAG